MPRPDTREMRAALASDRPPPFRLPLRVYYQDTDAGGVVFHGTYLDYFERARTEWLRDLGLDLRLLVERDGCILIVRELRVSYTRPALLDDLLTLTVDLERLGRAQFTLAQKVLRADEQLVSASVNLACVASGSFKPVRVPGALRAVLVARALEEEEA